jgi:hypothetical protein
MQTSPVIMMVKIPCTHTKKASTIKLIEDTVLFCKIQKVSDELGCSRRIRYEIRIILLRLLLQATHIRR